MVKTASSSTAGRALFDFSNQLDFYASAQRDLRHTKSAAGVLAFVTKDLAQQLRAAIGHQVLFGKRGCGIDQAHDLDDALDAVQVAAASCLQGAHQLNGNRAGRLLAFFGADGTAELTLPDLAIFARQVAT